MRFLGNLRFLCGLAAGLGLAALASCGDDGLTGDDPFGPAIVRLGDAVAAEVNGTPIYVSDVRREGVAQGLIERRDPLGPGSPLYTQLLEELVDQRLLALEAVRRGLDDTDESRRRVAAAREQILGNILVENVVDTAVTEDAVRRMYEEQVDIRQLGDEVRARHILLDTLDQANDIVERLNNGESFAQLALDYSRDQTTRLEGGDLGYFTPEMVASAFARVAFSTEVGEISEPFRSEYGWHVLKVEDRRAEEAESFEEMRPRIVRFMTFQEIQRLMDVLTESSDIRIVSGSSDLSSPEVVEPESADDFIDVPSPGGE
ncbi:MAG: peptidylprolyl isomerase [Maricaulaceae bacterium]|jgi:peptidyl-prolyl cis-trans isomerase C